MRKFFLIIIIIINLLLPYYVSAEVASYQDILNDMQASKQTCQTYADTIKIVWDAIDTIDTTFTWVSKWNITKWAKSVALDTSKKLLEKLLVTGLVSQWMSKEDAERIIKAVKPVIAAISIWQDPNISNLKEVLVGTLDNAIFLWCVWDTAFQEVKILRYLNYSSKKSVKNINTLNESYSSLVNMYWMNLEVTKRKYKCWIISYETAMDRVRANQSNLKNTFGLYRSELWEIKKNLYPWINGSDIKIVDGLIADLPQKEAFFSDSTKFISKNILTEWCSYNDINYLQKNAIRNSEFIFIKNQESHFINIWKQETKWKNTANIRQYVDTTLSKIKEWQVGALGFFRQRLQYAKIFYSNK